MTNNGPQNLPQIAVFSGGGIKGLAFGPALKQLQDAGLYNNLLTVIGSSVGGLTATMLAIGFSADQLEKYLMTAGEGLLDLLSTPEVFSTQTGSFVSGLVGQGAAAKGHMLYHSAQATLKDALGSTNITFADLAKKVGTKSPSGGMYRDLELTVTVEDPRGSYQIVCSPRTTPNMPIALAMRMTASLPFAFPKVRLTADEINHYTEGATEPLVKYNRITPERTNPLAAPFPKFPLFNGNKMFEQCNKAEKQKVIDDIREDLIKNSFNNGELTCTDGGVVDNLPIYLATDKVGGLNNTIAFDFEEPWKRNIRKYNSRLYQGFQLDLISNLAKYDKEYAAIPDSIDKNNVEPGKIYLDTAGNYFVRDYDNITEVHTGSLDNINLDNLQARLKDPMLLKSVLEITHQKKHTRDIDITPELENYFADVVLNPSWNDKVYYHIQNRVHESRIPPYHMLALLQKGNLLSFDIDDISPADFELETQGEAQKNDPTPRTHDQKVTYLLLHGYEAGKRFLNAKGIASDKSFFEMYPAEKAKASAVPLQSFQTQIENKENMIDVWHQVLLRLMKETHGEHHDLEAFLYVNLGNMREELKNAKILNAEREEADRVVGFINKITTFTEENIQLIVQAKIKCDKLFDQIATQLNVVDKTNFAMIKKTKENIDTLKKTNPKLAEAYDKLIKLKESSMFFEEMLILLRDESIIAGKRKPSTPETKRSKPIANQYAPETERMKEKDTQKTMSEPNSDNTEKKTPKKPMG
ncbi:MAG: patatin-like phospholipase family protein [Proteobacteria bacterium]|nr:patatin-like phospholipase family protein [Pseudomonadota bacterium]